MNEVGARKGDLAVLATQLAAGRPMGEAAAAAGMSERTASRRRNSQEFRELMERIAQNRSELIAAQLNALSGKAVETLDELMDETKTDWVRLQALKTVLSVSMRYQQHTWEPRVAALEAAAEDHVSLHKALEALRLVLDP